MLLTEVFDAAGKYDVVNLTPKAKVPHMLMIKAPGAENLVIRFCNYAAKGDVVKQVKTGDKFMQIQVMQLSPKGNLQVLKTGLGNDPIGAMNVICDEILNVMVKYRLDGALLRFPTKSLHGQSKTIGRLASRLLKTRGGGRFIVLPELLEHAGKYTYIMMYRKSVGITGVAGLEIDPELYTITNTKVGDIVTDAKTGQTVTKTEAIAKSIEKKEDKRPMNSATHFKISRAEIIKTFNAANNIDKFDATSYFEPVENIINSEGRNIESYNVAAQTFMAPDRDFIQAFGDKIELEQTEIDAIIIASDNKSINGIEALNAFTQIISDVYIEDEYDKTLERLDHISDDHPGKEKMVMDMARRRADPRIKQALHNYQLLIESKFNRQYKDRVEYSLSEAPVASRKAVEMYCAEGYININGTLTGNMRHLDPDTKRDIEAIDTAFKKAGLRIPKGMTLYRGQRSDSWVSKAAMENKAFYFSNFVSTSAKPIMYSGQLGSSSDISLNREEVDPTNIEVADKMDEAIYFGFVITETKVPAIFPGYWSEHNDECEFILPRGTVFKFNKTYKAGGTGGRTNVIVECEAVGLNMLEESEVIYDGDHLMETGEVKPMGFSNFVKARNEPKLTKAESFSVLANAMSFDGVSPKFFE
ncbi:RNA polymerase-ADP-ribosyltransferase [Aeromonas phage L9-6]|nr:RNA polymerase-ADP-ribosyltransferase [Aeromonas phage L9-6]